MQAGGENLVDTIFEGFQEQSTHKISEESRRFIKVDNCDAVMVGDLETDSGTIKVVRPNLSGAIWMRPSGKWSMN